MALSGPLATNPGTSRDRLPPASPPCGDRTEAKVSHLLLNQQRLTAPRYDVGRTTRGFPHSKHELTSRKPICLRQLQTSASDKQPDHQPRRGDRGPADIDDDRLG